MQSDAGKLRNKRLGLGGTSKAGSFKVAQEKDNTTSAAVHEYLSGRDAYVFSGGIYDPGADRLIDLIDGKEDCDKRTVTIFLTTDGGNPHAGYRMVRALQRYLKVRVVVAGRCKSAGTLIVVGANELALGPWGELGPLDMQITKPDELLYTGSGLEVMQAVTVLTENGNSAFTSLLVELIAGGLSTKTASEIAASLAGNLFQPIAAQIDPLRLAEAQRAIRIATDYGQRIASNLKPGALRRLVYDYPAHAFVIDRLEAGELFENVGGLGVEELAITKHYEDNRGIIRHSARTEVVLDVRDDFPEDSGGDKDAQVNHAGDDTGADKTEPRGSKESQTERGANDTKATSRRSNDGRKSARKA